jgi:hypothetical protein
MILCVVLGHGRRITFIEPQHIRLWTVQCASSQHQKPSFDGKAHIVVENSIPPFKIGVLWTKGDPIIVEISFFPPLRY